MIKIFCDGGARGNPGPAAAAFIVQDDAGNLRGKCGKYLNQATNNQAEYQAVLLAWEWLAANFSLSVGTAVNFYLDSQLIVSQLTGVYRVKEPQLKQLHRQVLALQQNWQQGHSGVVVSYYQVPRGQNFLADRLVNLTLDAAGLGP